MRCDVFTWTWTMTIPNDKGHFIIDQGNIFFLCMKAMYPGLCTQKRTSNATRAELVREMRTGSKELEMASLESLPSAHTLHLSTSLRRCVVCLAVLGLELGALWLEAKCSISELHLWDLRRFFKQQNIIFPNHYKNNRRRSSQYFPTQSSYDIKVSHCVLWKYPFVD